MNLAQLSALATWPLLAATMLLFGLAAFELICGAAGADEFASERMRRVWRWLAAVNLVAAPFAILIGVAEMADTSLAGAIALLPAVMSSTTFGRVWAVRLPLTLALLLVALANGRTRRTAAAIAGLAAAILAAQSLGGHAIDKGVSAVACYFVHELAAGTWLGALATLLMIGARNPALDPPRLSAAAGQVSRVAAWSVAALVATGAITAGVELEWRLDALFYSLYGRTLLWKLATAAAVVLVGGYNRYRLMPASAEHDARRALVRNVGAECLLLGAVLAWSALLANTPPPH